MTNHKLFQTFILLSEDIVLRTWEIIITSIKNNNNYNCLHVVVGGCVGVVMAIVRLNDNYNNCYCSARLRFFASLISMLFNLIQFVFIPPAEEILISDFLIRQAVFGCTICSSRSVPCQSLTEMGCGDSTCEHGNVHDMEGCITCDCVDESREPVATIESMESVCQSLEALGCADLACMHGNKKNSGGCMICECEEGIEQLSPTVEASNLESCPEHDCDRLNCPYGLEEDESGCMSTCKCKLPPSDQSCPDVQNDCSQLKCPQEILLDDNLCVIGCQCRPRTFGRCPSIDCSHVNCPNGFDDTLDDFGCVNTCLCKNT